MSKQSIVTDVPEIDFFDSDPAKVIQDMTLAFEQAFFEQSGQRIHLYPGDPMRIWLYTVSLMLAQGYNLANLYAKRNFLQYADGAWLDNLSATRGGPLRLPAAKAITTMRLTFSSALSRPLTIPAGIVALIGLLAALTTAFVVPWIKAKLGETRLETLYRAAEVAVYAAEQLGLTKVIKDKLAYAMEQVTAAMTRQGVTYDEATVRAAVEAAVRRMNGAG